MALLNRKILTLFLCLLKQLHICGMYFSEVLTYAKHSTSCHHQPWISSSCQVQVFLPNTCFSFYTILTTESYLDRYTQILCTFPGKTEIFMKLLTHWALETSTFFWESYKSIHQMVVIRTGNKEALHRLQREPEGFGERHLFPADIQWTETIW